MPYLGNTPSTSFATVVKDSFNGGSTAYTLSKVATTNSVSVFVENVRQEPTTAYSVSGTTLTFTATTPSGTGNIYVLHMNPTTTTTHPSAQALTATSGTFTGTVTAGSTLDMNGTELILDADADTSITADTDDQIDIKIGGTDEVTLSSSGIVINEGSNDRDFRVESNGNTHMLFVDGGNNGVGIGTSSVDTASTLTVSNTSDAHGITIVGAVNKSRMQFQGANTGSGTTDGLVIGLSSSDDTNDDSALIGLKENGSMTFQTNNTNHLIIDGNGHVTMPKQSAFLAYPNGDQSNMANDAVLVLDQEIYDQNADYNTSNYTFTAPVTGKYLMCVASRIDNADTSANWVRIELVTSNRSYSTSLVSPDVSPYMSIDYSIIVDMDASDTCYLRWGQSGGSATADMSDVTRWSGALIC